MLRSRREIIYPAEHAVGDGHVRDEFPVVALQYGVRANNVDEAGATGNRMHKL